MPLTGEARSIASLADKAAFTDYCSLEKLKLPLFLLVKLLLQPGSNQRSWILLLVLRWF